MDEDQLEFEALDFASVLAQEKEALANPQPREVAPAPEGGGMSFAEREAKRAEIVKRVQAAQAAQKALQLIEQAQASQKAAASKTGKPAALLPPLEPEKEAAVAELPDPVHEEDPPPSDFCRGIQPEPVWGPTPASAKTSFPAAKLPKVTIPGKLVAPAPAGKDDELIEGAHRSVHIWLLYFVA